MIDGRRGPTGSTYHVNYLSTTCHVYFGSVCGATPDGRHAWVPVSDGISPAHGADRRGPTAVIKSASRMDHARSGGTLLNQKFTPALLEGQDGIDQLAHLVRAYFKLDGHHIQFNVVTADDAARRAGGAREAPRPHRPRRRLQRLLLRPHQGPAGRDHRADGAEGVLERGARTTMPRTVGLAGIADELSDAGGVSRMAGTEPCEGRRTDCALLQGARGRPGHHIRAGP